eukprot:CAMPEP_0175153668 /NCGR_PEP_ID=MMETSP0087-20121206/19877_1 /TAXON_ID=136419 /ORGANISM="Unknown Unknown, Strain D1" /LENGTH=280 /DNA_ID=CAMNT_0016440397 /DNA_START=17 /DNA_END=856 /DNA_ORIENTATION=+
MPIWVVQTKIVLSCGPKAGGGIWATVRKIWQEEGVSGFYKGLAPSLVLVVNPVVQFVVYEELVKRLRRGRSDVKLSTLQYFVVGAFAKAVATVVTYPYQVLKARLQASECSYTGSLDAITKMWKEEGFASFFGGMGAKMTQTVLNSAFMFAFYEKIFSWILQGLMASRHRLVPLPATTTAATTTTSTRASTTSTSTSTSTSTAAAAATTATQAPTAAAAAAVGTSTSFSASPSSPSPAASGSSSLPMPSSQPTFLPSSPSSPPHPPPSSSSTAAAAAAAA